MNRFNLFEAEYYSHAVTSCEDGGIPVEFALLKNYVPVGLEISLFVGLHAAVKNCINKDTLWPRMHMLFC